jgi:hypothetical protein
LAQSAAYRLITASMFLCWLKIYVIYSVLKLGDHAVTNPRTSSAAARAINPGPDADGRRSRVDEVSDVVMSAFGTKQTSYSCRRLFAWHSGPTAPTIGPLIADCIFFQGAYRHRTTVFALGGMPQQNRATTTHKNLALVGYRTPTKAQTWPPR